MTAVRAVAGRRFYKMSGSGNDFVVVDARREPGAPLDDPATVRALCTRGSGVGADGVVFLERAEGLDADLRMRYLNSDGSRAEMCGNAALCVTRLAAELGAGAAGGMRIATDSGVLTARMEDGRPAVDLQPVRVVRAEAPSIALAEGEHHIGFALAGVPHWVVLCDDVDVVDVLERGRRLRRHPSEPQGANVNFVARHGPVAERGAAWGVRTYERGVEGETLACGTGAVATAVLLHEWRESGAETTLVTRSGRELTVALRRVGDAWYPTLRGEGRLVYTGELGEL